MKLMQPQELQMALDHDPVFEQARKLLWLDWDEDPNTLYQHPVEPQIVKMARSLQSAGVVSGRVHLDNYRDVSQMIGHHDRWFSARAKQELLSPFE